MQNTSKNAAQIVENAMNILLKKLFCMQTSSS